MTGVTLAIDQGTHASRAALYDDSGAVRFAIDAPVALRRRDGGRVEQDAGELLATTRRVVAGALAAAREGGWRVRAAGLATQRSTVVAWDRETGRALAPALSWQDVRAADRLASLAPRAAEIARRTGLRLSPHYGATKLAWLVERVPAVAYAAARGTLALGPLAAFLVDGLREGDAAPDCDHANAGRTLLLDLDALEWAADLARAFGVPLESLPACRPIVSERGVLADGGVPLRVSTGDQNAALLADGPPQPGVARVVLGTGAFVLTPTRRDAPRAPDLLRGIALTDDAGRCDLLLEGTVNGAGAALAWAAERYGLVDPVARLDEAFAVADDPPVFVNAVGGLGSPWWRADVASALVGPVEARADRDLAIVRAVGESVLFLLAANLDAMRGAGATIETLHVAGGLARSDALCRGLATLAGAPVLRATDAEATARGVARLAAGEPATWRPAADPTRFDPTPDRGLIDRRGRFREALEERLGS